MSEHEAVMHDFCAFVQAGPLYGKLHSPPPLAEWASRGCNLVAQLLGSAETATQSFAELDHGVAVRVYHLYLPMYFWMKEFVLQTAADRAKQGMSRRAVTIGLSAPQGCGKTTMVNFLSSLFEADGLRCAHVSIDDFYLTGADQSALAAAHPDNDILQVRGNAGTHDITLGVETLRKLSSVDAEEVAVPVYDKAARCGKGDRAAEHAWRHVHTPRDVILLEGWMLGFKALGKASDLASIHPALPEIDAALERYCVWDDLLDGWCIVGLADKSHVFNWRLEAERKMAAAGRSGMSDDAVRDFVARYLPAYTAYCPGLYAAAQQDGVDGKPTLFVQVDGSRAPIHGVAKSESIASEDWRDLNDLTVASMLEDISVVPSQVPTRTPTKELAESAPCSQPTKGLVASKLFDQEQSGSPVPEAHQLDLSDLVSFIRDGPLYAKLHNPPDVTEWIQRGGQLVAQLVGHDDAAGQSLLELGRSVAVRVYHLYLPMYFWMRDMVQQTLAARARRGDNLRRAVSIGLSAPQGCGKTTVVNFLTSLFAVDGLHCAHVSMDDFYLTGADQTALAEANAENALFQVRGNAGTHDIAFGEHVLKTLINAGAGGVAVPVYDKAARSGKGDRAPEACWRNVQAPCDVVLFEGWMAGFKPCGQTIDLSAIHPSLPDIDAALAQYQAWDDLLDGWCVLGLEDKRHVFQWRLEAERKMAAAGRPGMSDDAVRDFVARYMPAYTAYCPSLYAAAEGGGVDGKPTLLIRVDGSREPVACQKLLHAEADDYFEMNDLSVGSTRSDYATLNELSFGSSRSSYLAINALSVASTKPDYFALNELSVGSCKSVMCFSQASTRVPSRERALLSKQ